ncbi:centrosomal protein of 290 kDa isoform X2 [Rosa chinensis]|uniref:centrosomal protein of 290 kDa isoform X2 n=1 Tax=Rosa chinensis TaxID=74649 RepID=UPI001AD91CC4|nr:centrosomal protein of 290 kDa isoform X2 [Rosa chinensis]
MEEMISDLKESEVDQIALAEAFESLLARCKQIGDQFILTRSTISTRFKELQTREEEIGRREKLLEEKESGFKSKEEELDAIEEGITEKLLEFEEGKTQLERLNFSIDDKERRVLEVEELIRVKERECDLIENRIEKGTNMMIRIEESIKEMDLKVKGFDLHKKEMEDWSSKLELKEKELERLFEKLRLKEALLEPNVVELHVLANSVEECLNEAQRREREVELKGRRVESRVKEVELAEMRVEECLNEAQRREREVELKERRVESRVKEVELAEMRVNECLNEGQRKEREVELKERRVESRVKECLNEAHRKEKEVESKVKELELTEMRVKERLNKVELKEEHLCLMEKLMEENKRRLDVLMKTSEELEKHLDSLQKSVEERERNLDLVSDELKGKEREFQQRAEALELNWAQFDSPGKIQQLEYTPGVDNAVVSSSVTNNISSFVKADEPESSLSKNAASFLSSNLQPNATSDEGYVPGFLNENLSGNNFIDNELAASLRLLQDPAKLVLYNMQKSLDQYLRNGYFEESIMSGNLSILKELMSISPHVGPHLKVDATYLASQWKTKMRGNTKNSVESLAFLLFITLYGLVSMLNVDEIVKLLGLISQNKRALELCQTHAFAVKIADLIHSLIERKQLPVAVRCICMLKFTDMLPLVPLLEEYVQDAMESFKEICGLRITPDEKVKIFKKQIADARALVQCLKDYNLGSEHPSNAIEIQIVQLETLAENWKLLVPPLCPSIIDQHKDGKRKKHNTSTSDPEFQPQQQRKMKIVFRGIGP